jgi:hypothetical protein
MKQTAGSAGSSAAVVASLVFRLSVKGRMVITTASSKSSFAGMAAIA